MINPIYLDYQATTPVDPLVLESMLPYFSLKFGNNGSRGHYYGREADAAVNFSRNKLANYFNLDIDKVIFTSGATESVNLALRGFVEANLNKGNHIITSEIEHSAVIATCKNLEKYGVKVSYLRTDSNGLIDLDELKNSITKNTILVSIQSSNNEIGTIQPVEDISNICRSNNIIFHSDVTQSVGKHFEDYSLFDLFSLSAHKFYGPKGIGILGISHNLKHSDIAPQILGGNQEYGLRSGTLNVPLIVGLGKAIELIEHNKSEISEFVNQRDLLYNGIFTKLDNIYLNGDNKRRLSSNLNFYIEGVSSTSLIKHCSELCFSTGATCSSALGQRSRVLKAIGLTNEQIDSSIRLSVGRFTTHEEIEQAIKVLTSTINKLRDKGQK